MQAVYLVVVWLIVYFWTLIEQNILTFSIYEELLTGSSLQKI